MEKKMSLDNIYSNDEILVEFHEYNLKDENKLEKFKMIKKINSKKFFNHKTLYYIYNKTINKTILLSDVIQNYINIVFKKQNSLSLFKTDISKILELYKNYDIKENINVDLINQMDFRFVILYKDKKKIKYSYKIETDFLLESDSSNLLTNYQYNDFVDFIPFCNYNFKYNDVTFLKFEYENFDITSEICLHKNNCHDSFCIEHNKDIDKKNINLYNHLYHFNNCDLKKKPEIIKINNL